MAFDWMYATSVVLAVVLATFGLASFCVAAASIALGRWWERMLGVLFILLVVFVISGFKGGAA